ncbi:DUF2637 domain-containing protein [Pseudofrankia sp. DC12]|uniref:DUF2637 domain-containing protein n=1 Tax=Pseudofrankia sp. DC12 TaxID=683315 RepID=UPI0006986E01|nr:DUF2637 domain-containing protein [Pseudofrankia sp. DC12]
MTPAPTTAARIRTPHRAHPQNSGHTAHAQSFTSPTDATRARHTPTTEGGQPPTAKPGAASRGTQAPTTPTLGPPAEARTTWRDAEFWIRLATIAAVLTVAAIAAAVSYRHMRGVALDHGEDHTAAAIIPISVDGLIVAASMTLLADSRAGRRRTLLPYALLALSSAASVAANVMHAEPTLAARVIAAWPSAALIGAYELLMGQIRAASRAPRNGRDGGPGRRRRTVPAGQTSQIDQVPARRSDAAPSEVAQGRGVPAGPATRASGARTHPRRALVTVPKPGTKREALAALLATVAQDDPRTDYALARDLGPAVDLHISTARRYIGQLRQLDPPGAVAA